MFQENHRCLRPCVCVCCVFSVSIVKHERLLEGCPHVLMSLYSPMLENRGGRRDSELLEQFLFSWKTPQEFPHNLIDITVQSDWKGQVDIHYSRIISFVQSLMFSSIYMQCFYFIQCLIIVFFLQTLSDIIRPYYRLFKYLHISISGLH